MQDEKGHDGVTETRDVDSHVSGTPQLHTAAPPLDGNWKPSNQRPCSYIPIFIR